MKRLEDLTKEEISAMAEAKETCIGSQIFLIRFGEQDQEKLDKNIFWISFKATKESMYYAPKNSNQLTEWQSAWLFWSPGRFSLQII